MKLKSFICIGIGCLLAAYHISNTAHITDYVKSVDNAIQNVETQRQPKVSNTQQNPANLMLLSAAASNDMAQIQLALKSGANINVRGNWEITPLMNAALKGHWELWLAF